MLDEVLSVADRNALLARLHVPLHEPSAAYLAQIQRAWLFAQPFHNLDLLAGWAAKHIPFGVHEALGRCLAGLGGPCHVQSISFLMLLQSLGFDASLCGATITHQDDHLLVRVSIGATTYFADVGNGHPYLVPFSSDRPQQQEHLGWVIRSTPYNGGVLVERTSPDQPALRRVYHAMPDKKRWSDFVDVITRHHHERGYGPFVTGLRVVTIGEECMVVLRDSVCTRYFADSFERFGVDDDSLEEFIARELGFSKLPVKQAVQTWLSTRQTA